jgi:putative pyruvate formate lyase activating enzyme
LGCVFCQNYQISQEGMGRVVGTEEFIRLCFALRERGAENINIVTGSHAVPALVPALEAARDRGLKLPVFWNSSAYEGPAALSLLEKAVDGYLPDLKTLDSGLSAGLFNAPDYPVQAEAAIKQMMDHRQLRYSGEALVSGVIIRHLVLPGHLESTRQVLRWFAEHGRDRALLSLMTQYTPIKGRTPDAGRPERISGAAPPGYVETEEYETLLRWLEEFDIDGGFYQELVHDTGWLPDFSRPNPFSSALSEPVWHWKSGFLRHNSPPHF